MRSRFGLVLWLENQVFPKPKIGHLFPSIIIASDHRIFKRDAFPPDLLI
jgi:hypothetical protein